MPIATDPLSLLFIASFLFGLLYLIVTTVLGNIGQGHGIGHGDSAHVHFGGHSGGATHHVIHHIGTTQRAVPVNAVHTSHAATAHDASHHTTQGGSSLLTLLNPITITLFLLGFGFFGYVFHNLTNWALPLALVGACFGGIIVTMFLLIMLERIFGDSEGETIQDVTDRVGLVGKVSLTIQENGLGEILYVSPGGMRKSVAARSVDGRRLERGQEIVVVHYQHGIAEVDTWEHFLEQEQASTFQSPTNPDNDVLTKLRALLGESHVADSQSTQAMMQNDAQKE
jgi:hypothetical protein